MVATRSAHHGIIGALLTVSIDVPTRITNYCLSRFKTQWFCSPHAVPHMQQKTDIEDYPAENLVVQNPDQWHTRFAASALRIDVKVSNANGDTTEAHTVDNQPEKQ